jgi:hypothetical protein
MGLDHLERLVRECRAIDGDLSAHPPRWVLKGVGKGSVRDLIGGPPTKRPPGGCENHALDLYPRSAGETLEDRAVLTVDWHNLPAAPSARRLHELTTHDKRLFVCKGDALATLECCKSGVQSDGADNGVENDVDIIPRCGLHQTVGARHPLAVARRAVRDDSDEGRAELGGLLLQERDVIEGR